MKVKKRINMVLLMKNVGPFSEVIVNGVNKNYPQYDYKFISVSEK